jgi:hypothetical protein
LTGVSALAAQAVRSSVHDAASAISTIAAPALWRVVKG